MNLGSKHGKPYDPAGRPRYLVEVHNIEKNKWEEYANARTLDEAFDKAESAVGFSKNHDVISISDPQGFVIYDSDGFRQGEGTRLPDLKKSGEVVA